MSIHNPPVVLCFSGHDPTGGAGVQADIETLSGLGCHACTVVTALTAQDTANVRFLWPQQMDDFLEQARLLIADLPIDVVKIGLLGSAEIASAVGGLLEKELAGIPLVLDPILAAGGGRELARADLIEVIKTALLPKTCVLTPNIPEAQKLTGALDPEDCAAELLRLGCRHVLITGTHETRGNVVNRLYGPKETVHWQWERLPHEYHGSGCTLASALAAGLALGMTVEQAASQAQAYTWRSLEAACSLGRGQRLPRRSILSPVA
ncbi:MAG: hydroxymethylpyrimidine/phosphomethylpyrimidine kinase [Methylococcaceae bacterium]|nr:hydroxymethylpyrimidine/phosphomethylpyrimidine kinase [Methylococcaceae bacterium]